MYCSSVCKHENEVLNYKSIKIESYRTTVSTSFFKSFYQKLSMKENFCIICGKKCKQNNKIIDITCGFYIFISSIIPVPIDRSCLKYKEDIVTSLYKSGAEYKNEAS